MYGYADENAYLLSGCGEGNGISASRELPCGASNVAQYVPGVRFNDIPCIPCQFAGVVAGIEKACWNN